jgi:hypothetical protein
MHKAAAAKPSTHSGINLTMRIDSPPDLEPAALHNLNNNDDYRNYEDQVDQAAADVEREGT